MVAAAALLDPFRPTASMCTLDPPMQMFDKARETYRGMQCGQSAEHDGMLPMPWWPDNNRSNAAKECGQLKAEYSILTLYTACQGILADDLPVAPITIKKFEIFAQPRRTNTQWQLCRYHSPYRSCLRAGQERRTSSLSENSHQLRSETLSLLDLTFWLTLGG